MRTGLVKVYKNIKTINTPLEDTQIVRLKAGELVNISGYVFTARDSANQKFFQLIKNGEGLPIELKGQVLFYAGPTPAKPGNIVGSIGPTSSYRMDPYTPLLLGYGLKGMIGKGSRSLDVINSIKKNKAIYFVVVGGAAALIANSIKKCDEIDFKELKDEVIYKLYLENLTVVVAIDSDGNNIYDIEPPKYQKDNCHGDGSFDNISLKT